MNPGSTHFKIIKSGMSGVPAGLVFPLEELHKCSKTGIRYGFSLFYEGRICRVWPRNIKILTPEEYRAELFLKRRKISVD